MELQLFFESYMDLIQRPSEGIELLEYIIVGIQNLASKVKPRVAKFSAIYAHYFFKLWFWMKTNARKRFSDLKNPYLML